MEKSMVRIVIALLTLVCVSAVHAAPLVHFRLEGRKQGTESPFASDLQVAVGDLVEYRLLVDLDPPVRPYEQIPRNPAGTTLHGLSSLALEITQDSSAGIQVDFDSPAVLTSDSHPLTGDGWGIGTGARGGLPSLRSGTPYHDLKDIRAVHWAGVYTLGHRELVLSGVFEVASVFGSFGQVLGKWDSRYDPLGGHRAGGFWWDGRGLFATGLSEQGPNPFSDYVPLTLRATVLENVPEPGTIALVGVMIGTLVVFRRRLG